VAENALVTKRHIARDHDHGVMFAAASAASRPPSGPRPGVRSGTTRKRGLAPIPFRATIMMSSAKSATTPHLIAQDRLPADYERALVGPSKRVEPSAGKMAAVGMWRRSYSWPERCVKGPIGRVLVASLTKALPTSCRRALILRELAERRRPSRRHHRPRPVYAVLSFLRQEARPTT